MRIHRRACVMIGLTLAALGAPLGGCASGGKTPPPYARPYPGYLDQSPTLDIQVDQRTQTLTLTNTTAQRFGPSTLWLNKRFSRPIGSLEVGESREIPLREFSDQFGERFRGGGFFATREPERLVLAQVETTGFVDERGVRLTGGDGGETVLLGLVVVNAEVEGHR